MPTLPDPRNADLLVWIGQGLVPRAEAKVSVFDSVVQGGDAVWEGLRLYEGRLLELDAHLDRLFASARALAFAEVPTREFVREAIFATFRANSMIDVAHARVTLTRGEKVTSGMSPKFNQSGPCLIVLAEWKRPVYDQDGIRLVTSAIRRNAPQCLDSKIHHNNLLNNILAKIQADAAGVDDALMLDIHGFLAETNATNVFLVHNGTLVTPTTDSCVEGITRGLVIEIARAAGIPLEIRNVTLAEAYAADEMFTTGTMGELAPVVELDGRSLGPGQGAERVGPVTRRLQTLYRVETGRRGVPIPEVGS